ncbi:toxin C-terminal domain-containing protein, partial [Vibrio metschnikovii]|uniref:toxin C-terminal domain-containing protein n=2 Tax=Vibrio metschnikovii TaxID=28172 RepID=UPI002FC674DA
VNRYYDADSGQYLSPDPIGFAGGLRPQAYVHNPLEWVDPLGLVGAAHGGEGEDVSKTAGKGEVFYKTTKEATAAAKELGFEKTKFKAHGETVYFNKKTKRYISRDVGSGDGNGAHNGGVWKMAKSVKDLGSKNSRIGTFDANLNKIGD